MDWLDEYAEALSHPGGPEQGVDEAARRVVLKLAREVAHRTERVMAPLSTFLAGMFVADRVREGVPQDEATREALRVAEGMLPPGPPPGD
jgi:Domain of unknown function (DUF6457)